MMRPTAVAEIYIRLDPILAENNHRDTHRGGDRCFSRALSHAVSARVRRRMQAPQGSLPGLSQLQLRDSWISRRPVVLRVMLIGAAR